MLNLNKGGLRMQTKYKIVPIESATYKYVVQRWVKHVDTWIFAGDCGYCKTKNAAKQKMLECQRWDQHIAFMSDPANIQHCEECPINVQCVGVNLLPCGHYRCDIEVAEQQYYATNGID